MGGSLKQWSVGVELVGLAMVGWSEDGFVVGKFRGRVFGGVEVVVGLRVGVLGGGGWGGGEGKMQIFGCVRMTWKEEEGEGWDGRRERMEGFGLTKVGWVGRVGVV